MHNFHSPRRKVDQFSNVIKIDKTHIEILKLKFSIEHYLMNWSIGKLNFSIIE